MRLTWSRVLVSSRHRFGSLHRELLQLFEAEASLLVQLCADGG